MGVSRGVGHIRHCQHRLMADTSSQEPSLIYVKKLCLFTLFYCNYLVCTVTNSNFAVVKKVENASQKIENYYFNHELM